MFFEELSVLVIKLLQKWSKTSAMALAFFVYFVLFLFCLFVCLFFNEAYILSSLVVVFK